MRRLSILTTALVLALPLTANAHKMWLLPSQTTFSGENPLVTVDAAISNDPFYFNHYALPLDQLEITAPDGSTVEAENKGIGRYRNVFDLPLKQEGTYQIAVPMQTIFASWDVDGETKRWRGTASDFAKDVPSDAQNLEVSESIRRIETFVTNGAPTETVLKPSASGIDLIPITHPNDLYVGETGRFQLVVDGQPAAGLKVELIRGGTRYRNSQDAIHVTTGTNGEFTVDWTEPGMYLLEVASEDEKSEFPNAKKRYLGYLTTLEVLPQ